MKKTRRTFSAEFKAKAIKLVKAGTKDVTQIARELDVPRQLLYHWARQSAEAQGQADQRMCFRAAGNVAPDETELDRLRRKVAQLEEDNEILKKATAFFAKHHR